jgi:uridine phosphorylase
MGKMRRPMLYAGLCLSDRRPRAVGNWAMAASSLGAGDRAAFPGRSLGRPGDGVELDDPIGSLVCCGVRRRCGVGKLKLPKYVELPGGVSPIIGCKAGDIAPLVVLTNLRDHVRRSEAVLDDITHRSDAGWEVTTITGVHRGTPVTVCCAGIGAGQTSNVMEELINLGGKIFIQIGATGAIQEHIAMGDVVVPTGSVRDEGVTRYYAPKKYPAVSDYRVVHALAKAAKDAGKTEHTGIIRTTDGFYPSQRIEKYVSKYSDLGVLSVEQEVAAILTIAGCRNCYAGASLVVIGNLVTGEHSMNGDSVELFENEYFEQIGYVLDALVALKAELL